MTRNLINKKETTRKTKEVYFPCFTLKREDGEDMYDEIIFVFENSYKLKIAMDIADYMSIAEIKL